MGSFLFWFVGALKWVLCLSIRFCWLSCGDVFGSDGSSERFAVGTICVDGDYFWINW